MKRYDEARALLDLCLEKLGATKSLKETATEYEEATQALDQLSVVLDTERPRENELEPSNPLDPESPGVIYASGVEDVRAQSFNVGMDLFLRIVAPTQNGSEAELLLTVGTIRLERLSNATLRLSSLEGDVTYWEGRELDQDGSFDFIFRVKLGTDHMTGFVWPVAQRVHLPGLDTAKNGGQTNTATVDAEATKVQISCTDNLANVVVGDSMSAILQAPFSH